VAGLLVFSEHRDTALELVSQGREFAGALGVGLSAAALGAESAAWAADLGAHGAARVFVSDDPAFDGLPIDVLATALAQIVAQADASIVLLGSTRRGRELAGRLAQRLDAACVSDVNSLTLDGDRLVAGRYNLGGATIQQEVLETPVKVFAVMPKTFAAGEPANGAVEIVPAALTLTPSPVKLVERKPKEGAPVNLDAAERIVGIGRGLGKREDVSLGEQLAAALKAELACTKSLADFQWLPEERIVGLSGAKTKPDLYLAVGVSGQIQHTVGISGARVIAALRAALADPAT